MVEPKPQSVSLVSIDGRLQVEFHWQHDRFAQTLFLDGRQVGCSIEGDGEDPWPPSPPLQQLSCQQIDGNDVILGVGAAGRGHWSISVERADLEGVSSLKFEVACQSKDAATFLGSSYQLADAIVITASSRRARVDAKSDGGGMIESVIRLETGHTESGHKGSGLKTTHRWSYRLQTKNT